MAEQVGTALDRMMATGVPRAAVVATSAAASVFPILTVSGSHTLSVADPQRIRFITTSGNTAICTMGRDVGVTELEGIVYSTRWRVENMGGGIVEIRDDAGAYVDSVTAPTSAGQISGRWIYADGNNVWSENV